MTTSGTTTFTYNRDQIIKMALRRIGAISSGETPSQNLISDSADVLNLMVKEWDSLGIHLWTEAEGILFLQPSQVEYALGDGTTDHATQTNPPNYVQTTLAANAAASATTITVTSISNILANDKIGIVLDRGTVHWTTVSGSPSGVTVTLAVGLTDSATSGNYVWDYTSAILRPLRIVDARRYHFSGSLETPMTKLSRLDYRDMPNKTNTGTITSYFYDPLGGANASGRLYIWPAPSDPSDAVKFTWYRQIQDFNAAGDTPDLPIEWTNALIWNLAVELAPEFDVPPQRFEMVKSRANETLDRVQGFDKEPESIYFGVAMDYPQGRQ